MDLLNYWDNKVTKFSLIDNNVAQDGMKYLYNVNSNGQKILSVNKIKHHRIQKLIETLTGDISKYEFAIIKETNEEGFNDYYIEVIGLI